MNQEYLQTIQKEFETKQKILLENILTKKEIQEIQTHLEQANKKEIHKPNTETYTQINPQEEFITLQGIQKLLTILTTLQGNTQELNITIRTYKQGNYTLLQDEHTQTLQTIFTYYITNTETYNEETGGRTIILPETEEPFIIEPKNNTLFAYKETKGFKTYQEYIKKTKNTQPLTIIQITTPWKHTKT